MFKAGFVAALADIEKRFLIRGITGLAAGSYSSVNKGITSAGLIVSSPVLRSEWFCSKYSLRNSSLTAGFSFCLCISFQNSIMSIRSSFSNIEAAIEVSLNASAAFFIGISVTDCTVGS